MRSLAVYFIVFIASVGAQTVLEFQAAGALPDGSSAVAQGVGQGLNVVGEAIAQVTEDASISSAIIQATGPSKPAPKPTPKPKPVVIAPKPVVISKQYTAPVCSDIKDKQCPKIDDFKLCGFCLLQSYPVVKGYACNYQESYVLDKKGGGKQEVIITPLCKCDGKFIIEGKACPSCDKLLAALLKCAASKKSSGVIEIPEKCLKEVGATEKILKACGFLGAAKTQDVVVVDQKKPVIIVEPKKSVVVVPKTTVAATSTASVATATSTAQATSSASANAVASATAFGQ